MSGITLSASVRQNLLSLQSTTDLLSQTQERLSTGNKVNSALDNPTNYFTASSLNNRASDISNFLDGIGNGVQVLQAANTGITSLQSLIASAQSVANQALQATSGYTTKSQFVSSAITGATASNLLGGAASNAVALGTSNLGTIDLTGTPAGNAALSGTSALSTLDLTGTPAGNAVLTGNAALGTVDLTGTPASNAVLTGTSALGTVAVTTAESFDVNGATVNLSATGGTSGDGNYTASDLVTAINGVSSTSHVTATLDGSGNLKLTSTGTAGASDAVTVNNFTGGSLAASDLGLTTTTASGADANQPDFSFKINNQTVTLAGGSSYTASQVVDQINTQVGSSASVSAALDGSGNLKLTSTGTAGASDAITLSAFSGGTDTTLGLNSTTASGTAANQPDFTFEVNNQTVTFAGGSSYTASQIASQINTQVGTSAHVNATLDGSGNLKLTSTGTAGASDAVTVGTFAGGSASDLGLTATTASGAAAAPLADLTFKVNNQTVTLAGGTSYTAANIVSAINTQVGSSADVTASLVGGKLSIASNGTAGASDTVTVGTFSSSDATQLGFANATETDHGSDNSGGLAGETLTIGATAGGTATNITFGTADGDVSTIDQLNTALAANNLEASIDTSGKLTITTVNDDASSTIGAIGGTAVSTTGAAFANSTVAAPVNNTDAQNNRASLVTQYNNIITQIQTTAQDSSFNGVNLLNGDQLKLVFNETGSSTLNIQGVTDDPAGLGLAPLTAGADFLDNASTNKVLSNLTDASNTLRSQASTLGSNLSIVQIRQDFSKNLINVLQTGASNLTLADTNEEAANSQALSTRQSIAVSALALANTSQQSVLRLLQ